MSDASAEPLFSPYDEWDPLHEPTWPDEHMFVSRRFRTSSAAISITFGSEPCAVLLNASHTHAGPLPYRGIKIGGTQRTFSRLEELYIEYVPYQIEAAARHAAGRLGPARVAYGRGSIDLGANRRERTTDGET